MDEYIDNGVLTAVSNSLQSKVWDRNGWGGYSGGGNQIRPWVHDKCNWTYKVGGFYKTDRELERLQEAAATQVQSLVESTFAKKCPGSFFKWKQLPQYPPKDTVTVEYLLRMNTKDHTKVNTNSESADEDLQEHYKKMNTYKKLYSNNNNNNDSTPPRPLGKGELRLATASEIKEFEQRKRRKDLPHARGILGDAVRNAMDSTLGYYNCGNDLHSFPTGPSSSRETMVLFTSRSSAISKRLAKWIAKRAIRRTAKRQSNGWFEVVFLDDDDYDENTNFVSK
eukprot:CAMPEP_0202470156 /NCGR_PEP_ID=MMETSP1360-20130828/80706_1 /ASSEMBLY_ACC=CAM_ASM_000848 /TAXON_ID=515479 /ORGANISM="Licmophora paradoxa, Strain CCMP2313" /LENGTH=280 /DNA_ID=CAMNT_0049095741 /DNA_START=120 /DNA_END=962 /DNA_ORIENTATION=+